MEAPGFWDDAEAAQEKSKLLKGLKDDVETWREDAARRRD